MTAELQQRQIDALASMMGADSQRIDRIVDDVSVVKGKIDRVDKNVDELRSAMAVLVKHEVVMEQNAAQVASLRTEQSEISKRIAAVEIEMPQLRETRAWVVRAMLAALGVVGLTVIGLVIKVGGA